MNEMTKIPGSNRPDSTRTFEAAKKKIIPPSKGGRTDEETIDFLRKVVDKSKVTRPPTVVKREVPDQGKKHRTGPKHPDGSGSPNEK